MYRIVYLTKRESIKITELCVTILSNKIVTFMARFDEDGPSDQLCMGDHFQNTFYSIIQICYRTLFNIGFLSGLKPLERA